MLEKLVFRLSHTTREGIRTSESGICSKNLQNVNVLRCVNNEKHTNTILCSPSLMILVKPDLLSRNTAFPDCVAPYRLIRVRIYECSA